jgi:hypothetical protein
MAGSRRPSSQARYVRLGGPRHPEFLVSMGGDGVDSESVGCGASRDLGRHMS